MNIISAHERFQGYRECLESNGIAYDPDLVFEGDFSENAGALAAQKLLPLGVDGIFTSNDQMAIGFVRQALAKGLSLPGDVSVVGFDDLPIASSFIPSITTMRQPIRDIGITAIRILLGIIDGSITEPQHAFLPTELVIRET
jgi:LacI family transcriptional regulator